MNELIEKISKKFIIKNPCMDLDDLIQQGFLGYARALATFRKDKGTSFSTWAYYWIYGYISRYVKKNNDDTLSLNQIIESEDGDKTEVIDLIEDSRKKPIEDIIMLHELRQGLDETMNKMPLIESNYIKASFGWDGTLFSIKDIRESQGLSNQEQLNVRQRALRRLRNSSFIRMNGKEYLEELK